MKILVVIDMQNDFIDGALGTPEAQAIVPAVAAKVRQYAESGDPIIYTADTHNEDYLNTIEGKKLPVPHCIYGTHGWEIKDEVYTKAPVIMKDTFGSWELPHYVDNASGGTIYDMEKVESIEVVGLCTDICVISNVMMLKAWFPNTPIIVDASCCAGVTPESHENALRAMEMCHIEVIRGV